MRSPRILVVDDDRFFRDLFRDALLQPGWDVRTADGADQASALLADGIDVLVTDLVMPGRSGIELAREARERNPETEIVIISRQDNVRLAVRATQAGVADYLVKPVTREELVAAVSRCLDRAAERRERQRLRSVDVEFARQQHALYGRCLELLGTLEPERLHERTLDTFLQVCDARSGALWISDERGQLVLRALRALRGAAMPEALPERLDPQAAELRAGLIAAAPFAFGERPLEKAFLVPLVARGEPQGLALVLDRAGGADFSARDHTAAQIVGEFAGVALCNARRFSMLERVGLRDRETAAYNLSFFIDYASKEFYKARRYGRSFSLVTASIENHEALRKALGRDELSRLVRALLAALTRNTRDADIVARVADHEFYLLLPETDLFGALLFRRRASFLVESDKSIKELSRGTPLVLSMGAASFPKDGDDFDQFLQVVRERAANSRGSLVRKLQLQGVDFWASIDRLLGTDADEALPEQAFEPSASRRLPLSEELFLAMRTELVREIGRDPAARGLLYLGLGSEEIGPQLSFLAPLGAGESAGRTYLLGRRGESELSHPALTNVYLDGDEALSRHDFVLYLGEHGAYVLVRRHAGSTALEAFHSSDAPLVDHLVARLQEHYDLQPF